jgi:hypothetical protein
MASFHRATLIRRITSTSLAALVLGAGAQGAAAATYSYVDWQTASVSGGTASGVITLPDSSTVTVTFSTIGADGGTGVLYGAQVSGGTNYWSPSTPFISSEVQNAPPTPDILQLQGGLNSTYIVTLSEPIKDPVMAIVSLGQSSLPTTYDFDSPFTIVSQGAGYWGGSATALTALTGDVLQGREGHGTIRFIGTFSRFSWTVPTPELWHGFTFAIRTTERLEPTPDAGADARADAQDDASAPADAGGDARADAQSDASTPADAGGGEAGRDATPDVSTTPDGAGGSAGSGGAGGAAGSAGGRAGAAGSDGGGRGGASGRPDASTGAPDKDDSGCDCALPNGSRGSSSGAAAIAGALLLLGLRRVPARGRARRAKRAD